jgi:DNA-directed RNA polymerase I subunit RPA1
MLHHFLDHQYIVPTNGEPIRGLIQDHIVGGVLLTKRDTLLSKKQFLQLVYSCAFNINDDVPFQIPPPCILKPKRRWSGKQVITALLNQVCTRHMTSGWWVVVLMVGCGPDVVCVSVCLHNS